MIDIDLFEGVWISTLLAAMVVSFLALLDARRDQHAIKIVNGPARTLVAWGNVRREAMRLLVQLGLLLAIIPALLTDRPLVLFVPALLAVSVVVLVSGLLDTADRRALDIITVADVVSEFERIAAKSAQDSLAAIAVIDDKVDEVAREAASEITRTDKHQVVQDERIDNVEERK